MTKAQRERVKRAAAFVAIAPLHCEAEAEPLRDEALRRWRGQEPMPDLSDLH